DPSGSSSSYGGNPLVSAAAAAALRVIDEEHLVENSRAMGDYFLGQLRPFVERYPFVGEVRGEGLLLAIEFVRDKKTKEPLSKKIMEQFFFGMLRRGLLSMAYDSKFRIQPAMTIDRETIDEAVGIITETLDEIAESGKWTL
ncbi:MAG: aminotransferase class III-fold pyridoxal phosphate-dependent enzyme, partial [Bdellovibrionota bacterium]